MAIASLNSLSSEITSMTATRLSAAIRSREISCHEVMEAYLDRIEVVNPGYNAIVCLADRGFLLEQADAADWALEQGDIWGWMHGMPHAVKDLADAKGFVTSFGQTFSSRTPAEKDSLHIEKIRNAGAIIIGKTNVPEMGFGSQSYNRVYGVTGNAYDPALTAGGSSGGAACGLATQTLPVADGSDMMGSLRNPGAFNNVIGFRPSIGRVPMDGIDLFYDQLAVAGPMGRTVEDTIRLLEVMSAPDTRDPLSRRDALAPYRPGDAAKLSAYRVGWFGDFSGYLAMEPGVLDLCESALKIIEGHGCTVEECAPEFSMEQLWDCWVTLRHWIICSKAKALYDDPAKRAESKPEIIWEVEGGLDITGQAVATASETRSEWYRCMNGLFEKYDFLLLPSAQVFPFSAETHWPAEVGGRSMDTYHRWMEVTIAGTLAGCPVVNVPVGFDERGRPMGMQVIGPMGEDMKTLQFGLDYEAATDFLNRRPEMGYLEV